MLLTLELPYVPESDLTTRPREFQAALDRYIEGYRGAQLDRRRHTADKTRPSLRDGLGWLRSRLAHWR